MTSITIPNSVTSIMEDAFAACNSLTNVTIPESVTSIGDAAFVACEGLSAITVGPLNPVYSSAAGVLFNKSQTTLIQCPGAKAGTYIVPNSVTSIGDHAFYDCASLTNVTIPNSVTSIADSVFAWCSSLTTVTIPAGVTSIGSSEFQSCANLAGVYFEGNCPTVGSLAFFGANNATIYYLPGTTGWGTTFGGRPAVLWNPLIQASGSGFGVRTNRFGFIITGTSNIPIVVEACANLANASWTSLLNCALTNGSIYFSDPAWANYSGRFYRIRSP
jgi:hypothetical protein